MATTDERNRLRAALWHLQQALTMLDEGGQSVAAAQLDHVIQLVQGESDSDRGS